MSRPTVAAALLAQALAQAPARLRARLDAAPRLAAAWTWTGGGDAWTVAVDAEVTVAIAASGGVVRALDGVRCSCLLSPRCLHVLACLDLLGPAAEPATDGRAAPVPAPASAAPAPLAGAAPAAGRDDAAAAGRLALAAGGALLAVGARGAGALAQAELLRAVHAARLAGCHRLARALTAALVAVRELRAGGGDAQSVVDDLRTALAAACAAAAGDSDLGTARRAYAGVGALRLHGLCNEAVLTRSGHAGVLSWLIDAQGRRWSLADVQPGGPERMRQAWEGGADLGDLSLAHRALAGGGAIVQDATGSADGRLGAGRGVRAVAAAGAPWTAPPLDAGFRRPLAEQVAAAFAALAQAEDVRRAGDLLLLVGGTVLGGDGTAVLLRAHDGTLLRLAPASGDPRRSDADSLATLAAVPGTVLRAVGRLLADQPGTLAALALGPAAADESPEERTVRLPAASGGRLALGLEPLHRAALPALAPGTAQALAPPAGTSDPWAALARRLTGLASAGRAALPSTATLTAEAERLAHALCPAAAARLRALAAAVLPSGVDRLGRLTHAAPAELARAWTAAAVQLAGARLHLAQAGWLVADG